MKPQLISFPICPYVQRARILLDTKGVDYDTQYIDLADKPDWFLSKVPTGRVPALFVGDETLFESNVINEYLDDTTGTPVLPSDPLLRAREKAWMAYSDGLLALLHQALVAESVETYEQHKNALLDGLAKASEFIQTRDEWQPNFGGFEIAIGPLLQRIEQIPNVRHAFWERFGTKSPVGNWAQQLLKSDVLSNSVPENFAELFADYYPPKPWQN